MSSSASNRRRTQMATRTKTKATNEPHATEVDVRLGRIAATRREIVRLLNELGERVTAAEAECGNECEALRKLVRSDRSGATAEAVANGFVRERIDTGSLSSRLIDEVEARGHRAYPPAYAVERPRWAIVENR
jgi:phage host-nuclease inhibitor protein Gam